MRAMVTLFSVLALSCGGSNGGSSSGGGIPATTSYAAAGKIGSADVKDSIGFVLTGKEASGLHLAQAKDLALHRIKADGTVEKVKFMDALGSEITDAPTPAIVLTPSKKYLVLSIADEKATYVINITTGTAYKIDKVYAIEAHVQPLHSEDVIFVTHSDSVEDFYEDLSAYMIDMKTPDSPVVTMVSAADQGIYLNGFGNPNAGSSTEFRSLLIDKDGNVVYRGFGADMFYAFLRKTSGDFSKLESLPWSSGKGQLQRSDSTNKLINVITGQEIALQYTTRLGYVFSQDALTSLSSVCITLQQADGTPLNYFDFNGSTCQSMVSTQGVAVTDLGNLATAMQSSGYDASYDGTSRTFILDTKATTGFYTGNDESFNFQSTGEYNPPATQSDASLYYPDKNPFGREYQGKSVQFVSTGIEDGLVFYGDVNQNQFQALTNTEAFLDFCALTNDLSGQNQTTYFKVSGDVFYGKCGTDAAYAYIDLKTFTFYPISGLDSAFLKVKQVSHVSGTKFQIAGTNTKGKYVIAYWDNGVITEGTVFENPIISINKIN